MRKTLVLLPLMFYQPAQTERDWQAALAEKYHAQAEVMLWDRTRVDLLSNEYAYEN